MKKIITLFIICSAVYVQAQTTAPDEDTGPYTTCNPDGQNVDRDSYDLPNPVNVGTIDDRSCYANYKESQVFGIKWGIYNITEGSNHLGTSLQPRIERSLPRSQEVGVGSYALFKGTVRILEVGDAAGTGSDGTYMMQSKGKHTGGGGSPDPAICLYLVKPVLDGQGNQVSFKIYREQIKFRGGSGADGRDIIFLTDIGKNVPTDVELKVGFKQDPNDPNKRIHYSDAIIGGKVFKWNIPQPERGVESGIRYGAYRVKGGRAQIRWANTTYEKEEVPYDPNSNTNRAPEVTLTSPSDNTIFTLGEEIILSASASDPDGNLDKVNFKINDAFYRTDSERPFETTFTPTEAGTYKIAARAFDKLNLQKEVFVTIIVEAPNFNPTVTITSPVDGAEYELGETIPLAAVASDTDGTLEKVNFKVNGTFYSLHANAPYENSFTPSEVGTYIIGARAFDEDGGSTEVSVTVEVKLVTAIDNKFESSGGLIYPNPSSGIFHLPSNQNWQVYDLHGSLIQSGSEESIDLSNQSKGVYFLKVGQEVKQLILN